MTSKPHSPTTGLNFDELYREHLDFVWRCLRSRGVAEAHLEDAAHEVFIVLHRKLGDYDGRASVRTWMYGYVRKIAANIRRGMARAQKRSEQVVPELVHASSDNPSAGADTEAAVQRGEAAQLVQIFLDSLDPNCRESFFLSQIEGFSGPEIARMTGTNVNTIHARIRAGRQRFDAFVAAQTLAASQPATPPSPPPARQRLPLPHLRSGELRHGHGQL